MKKIISIFLLLYPFVLFAQGWQDVGTGVKATKSSLATGVYTMCADTVNHLLYVGGTFDTAGSVYCENVASWDGINWYSLPTEQGAGVDAMVMYKGNLYVGGNQSNLVSEWDGTSWTFLKSFNGYVNSLCVFNDTLYAGGSFTKSGNTTLNYIAKLDGTNWLPVGAGFNGYASPSVNAMCVWNGKLYAGGFFDESDTATHIFSIARWDDSVWTGLKSGIGSLNDSTVEGLVLGMDTFQGALYVGGWFGFAGGKPILEIAQWNGNEWLSVDTGLGGGQGVYTFVNFNNKLYIGGWFEVNGVYGTNFLTSWDGNKYEDVDTGTNNTVSALTIFNKQLYVGGQFTDAGQITANYIARWSPDSTTTGGIARLSLKNNEVVVYPNPSSSVINIVSSKNIDELKVFNLLGQLIYESQPKQTQFIFQLKDEGMYFVTVTCENETQTKKIVVVK